MFFPSYIKNKAKAFWQHTGEILSSRHAEAALQSLCVCGKSCLTVSVTSQYCNGRRRCRSDDFTISNICHDSLKSRNQSAQNTIKSRISQLVDEPTSNITLTVSGMAAIYSAYRLMVKHCLYVCFFDILLTIRLSF